MISTVIIIVDLLTFSFAINNALTICIMKGACAGLGFIAASFVKCGLGTTDSRLQR